MIVFFVLDSETPFRNNFLVMFVKSLCSLDFCPFLSKEPNSKISLRFPVFAEVFLQRIIDHMKVRTDNILQTLLG